MAKKSEGFESVSKKAQEIYSILSKIGINNPILKENRIFINDIYLDEDLLGVRYVAKQNTFGKMSFEPCRMVLPKHRFRSIGYEYTTTAERDEIAYKDLINGDGSITHYGASAIDLPTVGFTWKKAEGNLAKLTKFSIISPFKEYNAHEYEYEVNGWKRIQAPYSPDLENPEFKTNLVHNLPDTLIGQTEIQGITIPWEIDYDQKIQEIIDTSKLDDFKKRLNNLL